MRLLPPEEMREIRSQVPESERIDISGLILRYLKTQAELTRAETLREVGKLLEKRGTRERISTFGGVRIAYSIPHSIIKTLKRVTSDTSIIKS